MLGALLLFMVASAYAEHQGIPVEDVVNAWNPCVCTSGNCTTTTTPEEDLDLPSDYSSDLRLRSAASQTNTTSTRQ